MTRPATWVCALPDAPAAQQYAKVLNCGESGGRTLASHPGGRPWIVARGPHHRVLIVRGAQVQVAVLGRTNADRAAVERCLDTVGLGPGLAGRVMRSLDGCFHTFTAAPSGMEACGDVVGLCPVAWTDATEVILLGDSPSILSELAGSDGVDRVYLAARLLGWAPPSVHADRTAYAKVAMVPPGSAIATDAAGCPAIHPVWRFPDDDAEVADAAANCRDALTAAVTSCAAERHRVVGEFSGGRDSAALGVLGHRAGVLAATLTRLPVHGGAEDTRHARALADRLHGIEKLWIEQADAPGAFAGMDRPLPGDDLGFALLAPDVHQHLFRQTGALGDTLVAGHGADEILTPPYGHLVELAARDPRLALSHLRGYAALDGVRTVRALRCAARGLGSYTQWLHRWRDSLTKPARTDGRTSMWGWEPSPVPPPWVADEVRRLVAHAVCSSAEPLHERRHQHRTHAVLMWAAADNRAMIQAARHAGLHLAMPFLDRPVLEAFGAVRAEQRRTPYAYKQALTAAMDGLMPDESLRRRTKSGFSLLPDLIEAAPDIARALENPRAADLGLVDRDAVRDALARVLDDDGEMSKLTATLAVELWLRRDTDQPTVKPSSPTPCTGARSLAVRPAPDEPRAEQAARIRFVPGVVVVLVDQDDSGGTLTFQGRALAVSNPSAVAIVRALRDGTDPLDALRARFPRQDRAALAEALDGFIARLAEFGVIARTSQEA